MVKPYTQARARRSASTNRLATPSQPSGTRYTKAKTRLFAVLAPEWWNQLPTDIRTVEFRRTLNTHLDGE